VHISDVTIEHVQTGIVLATNNIDGTEGSEWWDFSGVTITDVTIRGATNWSVAVETPATTTSKYAGITLQNIYAESLAVDGPFGGGNGGILRTPSSASRAAPTGPSAGISRPRGGTTARQRRSGGRRPTATPARSEPSCRLASAYR
jgi:hypothetical protein